MEMMNQNFASFRYALTLRFADGRGQANGRVASSGAYGRSDYRERVNAASAAHQGALSLTHRRECFHGVHMIDWW